MNSSFRSRAKWALWTILLLTGCEGILTQNPGEHFVDGKLPKGAFRFANQIWDMPALNKVIARLQADATNPHLVRVGVIDNGLDYSHPDLIQQIDFGTDGKRITSAGFDIMGGDRFASPQILRYEYYAFGADSLEGGKIKAPPADPFKKIADYDRAFLDAFIPKLQANPLLKGTIWTKFTKENFSLYGAHLYLNSEVDMDTYRRTKLERPADLINLQWKPKSENASELLTDLAMKYHAVFEDFVLGPDGVPAVRGGIGGMATILSQPRYTLGVFEGADIFYAQLEVEFNRFAAASGYQKDFNQLLEFMKPRLFNVSDSPKTMVNNSIEKLTKANFYNRKGYAGLDPFLTFEDSLYNLSLTRKLESMKVWPTARVVPGIDDLKSVAQDTIQDLTDTAEYAVKHPAKFKPEEIKDLKDYLKKVDRWKIFFEGYLARKGWDPKNLGKVAKSSEEVASSYRRYLIKTRHPLLDPAAIDQSHGTHVAGVIAKQNENVRIVPLRVVTESTKNSPLKDPQLLSEFKEGFSGWLREPLVVRALEGRFSPILGGKKGAELITSLETILRDRIPKDFETNKLDFRFLGEVEEAIQIAGKEKLKLVNISLGTGFDRAVIDYRNLSSVKTVEAYFQFLKFEYFKWRIGKAARDFSPHTLFVIATGNDGAWLDGRSRSALPVDLSSPFLADFEDAKKGLVAPNNSLKNFLGVGSISQVDELSSFSNILISKTPLIFAHGEEVLSPVRPLSDESIKRLYDSKISPKFFSNALVFTTEERLDDFLIEKYGLKGTAAEIKEKLEVINGQRFAGGQFLQGAEEALQMDLFLQHPAYRQRMSGTSMAAPTMTGLLANSIEMEMRAKGVNAAQLYDHPEFKPERLIEKVFKKADPVYKGATVIDLKKWTGEFLWEKTEAELALDAKIRKFEHKKPQVLSTDVPRKSLTLPKCGQLLGKK